MLLTTTALSFFVATASAASSSSSTSHETMATTHSSVVGRDRQRVLYNDDCVIKGNGSMECANFCGEGKDYIATSPQQLYHRCEVIGCSKAPGCIANGNLPHSYTNLYASDQKTICYHLCDNKDNYISNTDDGDNDISNAEDGVVSNTDEGDDGSNNTDNDEDDANANDIINNKDDGDNGFGGIGDINGGGALQQGAAPSNPQSGSSSSIASPSRAPSRMPRMPTKNPTKEPTKAPTKAPYQEGPNPPCNFCGTEIDGFYYNVDGFINRDDTLVIVIDDENDLVSCGEIEDYGRDGYIEPDLCGGITDWALDVCICGGEVETTTTTTTEHETVQEIVDNLKKEQEVDEDIEQATTQQATTAEQEHDQSQGDWHTPLQTTQETNNLNKKQGVDEDIGQATTQQAEQEQEQEEVPRPTKMPIPISSASTFMDIHAHKYAQKYGKYSTPPAASPSKPYKKVKGSTRKRRTF